MASIDALKEAKGAGLAAMGAGIGAAAATDGDGMGGTAKYDWEVRTTSWLEATLGAAASMAPARATSRAALRAPEEAEIFIPLET